MIAKNCIVPLTILKLDALLRRLPPDHEKRPQIQQDLNKRKAGFRGEKAFFYYLQLLPDDETVIFHDLRLPAKNQTYFQIDFLLLTPNFLLINEVKNMSGRLYFDRDFSQLIRTENEQETVYADPMKQVIRQQYQLKHWLKQNHFPEIPIEYGVVFSGSTPYIKTAQEHKTYYRRVIRDHQFLENYQELQKRFPRQVLDSKTLKKLSKILLKSHEEQDLDVLHYYQISPSTLHTGVQCPKCKRIPMKRKYGTWQCDECSYNDRTCHEQAIQDFLLLFNTPLNRQSCSQFLQLPTPRTAAYMLQKMNLPQTGQAKSRKYLYKPIEYDTLEDM